MVMPETMSNDRSTAMFKPYIFHKTEKVLLITVASLMQLEARYSPSVSHPDVLSSVVAVINTNSA